MKKDKIIYYIATGLITALMLMSAGMYFVKYDMVSEVFTKLGFPTFIIYPLAILKLLGLVAIWSRKSISLKEWAYAGFFFDFVLALGAHLNANDNEYAASAVALVLLGVSYLYDKKVFGSLSQAH